MGWKSDEVLHEGSRKTIKLGRLLERAKEFTVKEETESFSGWVEVARVAFGSTVDSGLGVSNRCGKE